MDASPLISHYTINSTTDRTNRLHHATWGTSTGMLCLPVATVLPALL